MPVIELGNVVSSVGLDGLRFAGVPVDGAVGTGTFAGIAVKGASLTDTVNAKRYINGGTQLSPLWKLVTSA